MEVGNQQIGEATPKKFPVWNLSRGGKSWWDPQRGWSRTPVGSTRDQRLQVRYSLSIPVSAASGASEIPLDVAGGSSSISRERRQQQFRGQSVSHAGLFSLGSYILFST